MLFIGTDIMQIVFDTFNALFDLFMFKKVREKINVKPKSFSNPEVIISLKFLSLHF